MSRSEATPKPESVDSQLGSARKLTRGEIGRHPEVGLSVHLTSLHCRLGGVSALTRKSAKSERGAKTVLVSFAPEGSFIVSGSGPDWRGGLRKITSLSGSGQNRHFGICSKSRNGSLHHSKSLEVDSVPGLRNSGRARKKSF